MTDRQTIPETFPRISIVTPSFNQGQFLEETILSVLNQGYPDLEYFVMDGRSTDNSVEVIQKYASRLTYWESKPDRGQSHAINKGFKLATGELVAWLNSDDLLNPGALFEVAEIWQTDQTLGFIHGISDIVDEDGKPTGKTHGSSFDFTDSLLASDNSVAQPSTFISHMALKEVGYLDEDLHMSMDWDLWLRIGNKYPVCFLPKVLSRSRFWALTKTNTQVEKSGQDHVTIVRKLSRTNQIDKMLRKQALAAAYGRKAVLEFKKNKTLRSKISLLNSLVCYPQLKGGEAKKIRKKVFPVYFLLREKFLSVKQRLINTFIANR